MSNAFSRRKFIGTAAAAALPLSLGAAAHPLHASLFSRAAVQEKKKPGDRIVDIHVHYDKKVPNYIDNFLRVSDRLNLTACMLTPFADRKVVADAAKKYPDKIIPFGFVDLDAPDVAKQVAELHDLGYRGLGELEFVKKPYNDLSYFPVYELANSYKWILLFHTGIVLRAKFDEPEDVASHRMRSMYVEEIARRFPKTICVGAHMGNPEYEWSAEISRWNPNVFFDLSGTSLTKFQGRLADFRKILWWSNIDQGIKTPNDDQNAFIKLVFGSDTSLEGIEGVLNQYNAVFDACDIPEKTRKMILGGTLSKFLGLQD